MLAEISPGDIVAYGSSGLIIAIRATQLGEESPDREWCFIDQYANGWMPLYQWGHILDDGSYLPHNKVVQLRLQGKIDSDLYSDYLKRRKERRDNRTQRNTRGQASAEVSSREATE